MVTKRRNMGVRYAAATLFGALLLGLLTLGFMIGYQAASATAPAWMLEAAGPATRLQLAAAATYVIVLWLLSYAIRAVFSALGVGDGLNPRHGRQPTYPINLAAHRRDEIDRLRQAPWRDQED